MWRKTVLRRICKFLPKSVELGQALALDDAASRGGQGLGLTDAIDGTWSPVFDVESAEPTLMVPEKDVFARIADAPTETDLLKLFGEIERLRSAERMLAIEAFNARKSEFQSQRVAA
jgi:recombination protein RecT